MALTPRFTMGDIDKKLKGAVKDIEDNMVRVLRRVGVDAVNYAREIDTYTDRTRNLRGSTGWLVAKDGEIIDSQFEAPLGGYLSPETLQGERPDDGHIEGEAFARTVLSDHTEGLVLIVVAGMNYAAYVEERGYDVLTGAEMRARREVQKLLKAISE